MSGIHFEPEGGNVPSFPGGSGPSGPATPGFGATGQSGGSGAPSPMQVAASAAPTGPVNEYEEPPVPTVASAPKSFSPLPTGATLTNFSAKGNQITVSLNLNTGNPLWLTTYNYQATVSPAQLASLQGSGATSLSAALASMTPPPSFQCTSAMNTLTHFPSNMALFAKEFPYEYQKFMKNIEIQIFEQVNQQQNAAMAQIKQTMQQMESD